MNGVQMIRTCNGTPTQYEGTVDGYPAYFRFRWGHLEFTITKKGTEPCLPLMDDVLHHYSVTYDDLPWAGDMSDQDAREIMRVEIEKFRIALAGRTS